MHDMSPIQVVEGPLPTVGPASPALPLAGYGLCLMRGGARLLDIPQLSIEGSGPTVILGPNGAGKSLLVRLLHGIVAPSAGEVRIAGRVPDRADRARQAMVFQRPVLLRRSVLANLTFALRARGVKRRERASRAEELLDMAGLSDRRKQPARALSGGEEQRLALACALTGRPELLFLDEPTSSLDPAATAAIEAMIAAAARAGTKVVLVTHDIGQARRLADEVIFLNRGRIEDQAPAADFFLRPRSAAARAFLRGRLVI